MDIPENGVAEKLLEEALTDTQKLSQDESLTIVERKVIGTQYYILLFIIGFIHKERTKRESTLRWLDRLQWVIIPILISGFAVFIWQALYFYFVIVPDILKSAGR